MAHATVIHRLMKENQTVWGSDQDPRVRIHVVDLGVATLLHQVLEVEVAQGDLGGSSGSSRVTSASQHCSTRFWKLKLRRVTWAAEAAP